MSMSLILPPSDPRARPQNPHQRRIFPEDNQMNLPLPASQWLIIAEEAGRRRETSEKMIFDPTG